VDIVIQMALTALDKDNTNRLFEMLSINDRDHLSIIKKNHSSFSQLKLIAEQMFALQHKAHEIIDHSKLNDQLHKIPMNCKKVPGRFYYHYKFDDNRESLSMIAPDEWASYTQFLGKYLYNYDHLFYFQES